MTVDRVEWTAVVDRFEGDWAVLLVGEAGDKMEVPRHLLPSPITAGDHLKVRWELDAVAGAAARERLRRLREALQADRGDFDL